MYWDQELVDGLDLALNEVRVCGLRYDRSTIEARLLVEVLALPEVGPIDPDPRRVVVFSELSGLEVTLRRELGSGLGPVLPLDSLEELDAFFAGLAQVQSMYGWSFIDRTDFGDGEDWDVPPSILVRVEVPGNVGHSLHWFAECGRPGLDEGWERFVVQGVIRFGALRVERADQSLVPLEEFVADARRWWKGFQGNDDRLSVAAQQQAQAGASSWRPSGGSSVMVPGKSS